MNDDFLYRLRKEPPREFSARLRKSLERQAPQPERFSVVRALVLGLLVAGSAFAATLWVVHSTREDETAQSLSARVSSVDPAISPRASSWPVRQPRLSSEPTSLDVANEVEQGQPSTAAGSTSSPRASSAGSVAAEPAQNGVIGGFATSSRHGASGTGGTNHRHLIRVAASGAGIPVAEGVAMRMGSAVFALDADRVDDDEAFRRLCASSSDRSAHLVLTMRAIGEDELRTCDRGHLDRTLEAKLGYVGVAISAAKTASAHRFSPREIFLALAKRIPDPANSNRFVPNPIVSWHQVHPGYQERLINFFGPEQNSPLAQTFAAIVLKAGCDAFPSIRTLRDKDPEEYERICHEIREDAIYTPVYEGEFFLTQTLWGDPNALAILSMPFFDEHRAALSGSVLAGSTPTEQTIRDGSYEAAKPLYLYTRRTYLHNVRNLQWFVNELVSERAIGPRGYLVGTSLIPLGDSERAARPQPLQELNNPVP